MTGKFPGFPPYKYHPVIESDTKFTLAAEAYISHFDGVASDSLVAIIMHVGP